VSEWADRHRILPPTSAEPGSWRTDRVPYLAEIMDVLSTGSPFERVVLMKSAQAGGTEVGLNWLAYLVCHAPGLALLVQPSLDMARRNTRTRIDPMIESTPALRERISEPRSRDAYNSAFTKSFPGGMLVMSRIEKAFLEGDQRRFEVACIHCGSLAPIEWKNIRWPEGKRELAHLVCEACDAVMQELDKPRLLAGGSWRATADGDGRTASFHISALYSPFVTWAEIAIEHGAARGDPARMQAWQNLAFGEVYEDLAGKPLEIGPLAARAEGYTTVPPGVLVIVCGADTQDDRIELEILGVGLGDETWSLDYRVLVGDPSGPLLWQEVDTILRQQYGGLPIRAACIDSGGHHALRVYDFVRDKGNRSIWAIKGSSMPGVPPWPRKPTRVNKNKIPLYIIGTDSLKDAFAARLRIETPGPGYCHFPIGRGLDYYAGLTSERPLRKYHNGIARRVWTPVGGARNEPLDTRIYAMSALEGLKASGLRLEREAQRRGGTPRQSLASRLAR
jgi:phage terminase large subunit GpA-like protein